MRFRFLACSLMILGLVAAMAQAGSMNTFLTVANRFDAGFNPLPLVFLPGGAVANGQAGIYQIDISFTASNGAGDKGWANTLFDMGTTGNATLDLPLGYTSNSNTVDTNGALPGGVKPIFATNTDGGTSGDLKAIIASIESATITSSATDTRNNLGTATAPVGALNPPDPGSWIGTVYVDWDGTGQASVAAQNQQYSFTTTAGTFGPTQQGAGASALFGAALAAPVVNSLLLVNNTLNATVSGSVTATNGGVLGPAVLGAVSYTPGFGALPSAPGSSVLPTWNPATGAFSWNTTSATRGTYVWNVSATNAGGTGNGTITVEQHAVPEPATLALLGLAGLGLVGFARRR